jgi:hypothetical protein
MTKTTLPDSISHESLKELTIARDIVNEIRAFGINDNIICSIIAELALDLSNFELMKTLREIASNNSTKSILKEIGLNELENLLGENESKTVHEKIELVV